jgi:hypothetical protein
VVQVFKEIQRIPGLPRFCLVTRYFFIPTVRLQDQDFPRYNGIKTNQCLYIMLPVIRFYYTDRLFSQVLRHFLSFFAARILGVPHIHYPYLNAYTNDSFAELFDSTHIIDQQVTYEAMLEMQKVQGVQQWCDHTFKNHFRIQDLFSPAHITLMRDAYKFQRHTATFDLSAFNVAIHIRRGDIARHHTGSRYTSTSFFINTVNKIKAIHPHAHIHVYSDSTIDLGVPNIYYHILDNLLESMHDMICADVLVMSVGSNMSFFAGLMSRGLVYFNWTKLEEPYNAELNRYWSDHPHFLNEATFYTRLNGIAKTPTLDA